MSQNLPYQSERILLRADLDVPLKRGQIDNDYRLQAFLPTLSQLLKTSKKVLIIGHQGRPTQKNTENSLLPIKEELERLVHQSITFISEPNGVGDWQKSSSPIALLENLRFFPGEKDSDREFATKICQGSQKYIFDSFSHFHPSASLQIIPEILPTELGASFNRELSTLTKVAENTHESSLLIISGAKPDKLLLVEKLVPKFTSIVIGGRLASLPLPDFLKGNPKVYVTPLTPTGLDINTEAMTHLQFLIPTFKTIVFNGPLGKFEDGSHSQGTLSILTSLKDAPGFTLLGGGDTINAIKKLGLKYSDFDFVSTAGGAMLDFLLTGTHPLLEIIARSKK